MSCLQKKGTTHNTNGIIVQRTSDMEHVKKKMGAVATQVRQLQKSARRSLAAADSQLVEFHGKPRHGPAAGTYADYLSGQHLSFYSLCVPVSYTHLTLPTIYSV
eukprot:TRINITY_DN34856_c0_g1_i1.p1 TRINITY_DN34856_c0_g1~~TRINITY_DN34856_c0_g1_i1.p1  ORF type:complete len:104 (-),score=16.69 TRINITY_DN34856_c0_g1_i1:2-313(-)